LVDEHRHVSRQPEDLSPEELEARLRPGGFSQQGFLGPRERLVDVVAQDGARLARRGVTYDEVASRLEGFIERGEQNRERWVRVEHDARVYVVVYKGYQLCPWSVEPDDGQCTAGGRVRFASTDWRIRHERSGRELRGPGLLVHLIRSHHFFEGIESPYRVDPDALCELLGLGGARTRA
jgi:hypothetical protein